MRALCRHSEGSSWNSNLNYVLDRTSNIVVMILEYRWILHPDVSTRRKVKKSPKTSGNILWKPSTSPTNMTPMVWCVGMTGRPPDWFYCPCSGTKTVNSNTVLLFLWDEQKHQPRNSTNPGTFTRTWNCSVWTIFNQKSEDSLQILPITKIHITSHELIEFSSTLWAAANIKPMKLPCILPCISPKVVFSGSVYCQTVNQLQQKFSPRHCHSSESQWYLAKHHKNAAVYIKHFQKHSC